MIGYIFPNHWCIYTFRWVSFLYVCSLRHIWCGVWLCITVCYGLFGLLFCAWMDAVWEWALMREATVSIVGVTLIQIVCIGMLVTCLQVIYVLSFVVLVLETRLGQHVIYIIYKWLRPIWLVIHRIKAFHLFL